MGLKIICTCGNEAKLLIGKGPEGFYVGYGCINCGPITRESDFFETIEEAKLARENQQELWRSGE